LLLLLLHGAQQLLLLLLWQLAEPANNPASSNHLSAITVNTVDHNITLQEEWAALGSANMW
jgi:hypothetical protein